MLYSLAVNMPAAEPKVVVAHREDLWWLLAEACQLEPSRAGMRSRWRRMNARALGW
jgi:hypothetical protein